MTSISLSSSWSVELSVFDGESSRIVGPSDSCFLRWRSRLVCWPKHRSQRGHLKGRSLLWIFRTCRWRLELMEKERSQYLHLYGCSPVWVLKWRVKLADRGNTLPQNLQLYLSFDRTSDGFPVRRWWWPLLFPKSRLWTLSNLEPVDKWCFEWSECSEAWIFDAKELTSFEMWASRLNGLWWWVMWWTPRWSLSSLRFLSTRSDKRFSWWSKIWWSLSNLWTWGRWMGLDLRLRSAANDRSVEGGGGAAWVGDTWWLLIRLSRMMRLSRRAFALALLPFWLEFVMPGNANGFSVPRFERPAIFAMYM